MVELTKQVGGLTQEFRGLTQEVRGMKGRLDSIDTRLAKVEAWESRLDAVEQQLREQARSPARRRSTSSGSKCFSCGGEGHYRYECPRPPTVTFEDQIRCLGCGERGHSNASCPPVWISFLDSKGSGKIGRTDDAGQSSVLTSVRQVQDSRPEPSVEDSVGQTISFTEVGLVKNIEEDERVRPRSVNLLGDSSVIDSKERKPGEVREEDGRCRRKDQGRFKGRVYGLLRHRALIKCRRSEEDQGREQLTVGADPSGSSQGFPRGGRFVHPVGPGSGFLGMDGWEQQSHDRQIGFHGTPQEGHHAYPVGPSSGYPNRQIGFHGTPQEGHHAYPVDPSSGYPNRQVGFHGTPQEGHHAYPVGPSSGHTNRQVEFHGTPQEGHHAYPVGPSSGHTNTIGR